MNKKILIFVMIGILLIGIGSFIYLNNSKYNLEVLNLKQNSLQDFEQPYTLIEKNQVDFKELDEINFYDEKYTIKDNVVMNSPLTHHCEWYPDGSGKEDLKLCRLEVEIEDVNEIKTFLKDFSIIFKGVEEYNPKYYISEDYEIYYEKYNDKEPLNKTENTEIKMTLVERKYFKDYTEIKDFSELSLSNIISIKAEFEMPKYASDRFDIELNGKLGLSNSESNFLLDPDISACGTLSTAGATYTQTADITPTGDSNTICIEITNQNITYNGNGYSIINTTFKGQGIRTNNLNITIKNTNISLDHNNLWSSAIYLDENSENSLILNNTLGGGRGIFIWKSNNNLVANNTFSLGNYTSCVDIATESSYNTISNNLFGECEGNIFFSGNSNHNIFKNSNLTNTFWEETIRTFTSPNSNNSIVNMTYNKLNESIASGTEIIRKWYYSAQVNGSSGSAIEGSNITIYNSSGSIIDEELTDINGQTNLFELTEYINNGTRIYNNNYTINASFSGSTTVSQSINITNNLISQQFTLTIPSASINITSPLNTTYTTLPTTLNWTKENALNCLYTNNSGATNTTVTCGDLTTAVTFSQGSSTYFMWTNNAEGVWISSNVSFFIDSIEPATKLTYPADLSTNFTTYVTENQAYIKINWTVTDTNLQTCKIWNGTGNATVTCGDNGVFANNTFGRYNFVLYANDTYGNYNISSINTDYNYSIFYRNEDYNKVSTSGATETFRLNVSINPSQVLTTAYLIYNNTNQGSGTIVNVAGNNYTVTKTFTIPNTLSSQNATFYWNLTLDNGVNSTTHLLLNQTIDPLTIDDCSTGTYVLYNFTIKDEEDLNTLDNTTLSTSGDLNFQLFDLNRVALLNYSNSYPTNSFAMCLNAELSGSTEYLYDLQVQYGATGYSTEFYHIQNETLNATELYNNISLYDLNSTDAQSFKIIFRSAAFLPVENALIEISRKYIDEGLFRVIEIPKTDVRGEAVASLVLNDVIYKFEVVKFGVTLLSYDDVKAVCQTPVISTCEIDLNAFAETILIPDFSTKGDFNFTLDWTEGTRTVSSNYLIPSGAVSTVELVVTRTDALGTAGCSDSLISASGVLSCVVPANFGNGSITAKLTVDSEQKAFSTLKIGDNKNDIYGAGGVVVLSLFLFLTLLGAGLGDNPISTVVFLLIGVILLMGLNLIDSKGFIGNSATVLFLFVAVILIIIKGSRRN